MLDLLDSRRLRFVLTAMLHVAASKEPVSGKRLAELLECPRRYLEPDMQSLVQHGILESKRGARGGYYLARNPQRISLLDILRCLTTVDDSQAADEKPCPLREKVVEAGIRKAVKEIESTLAGVSLATWLEEAARQKLLATPSLSPDFCI